MTPANLETSAKPGTVGRFRVVAEIGRGGMGVVYLAEDPTLERSVALKMLGDHLAGLAKAHEKGVVHRDLKPENVVVERDDPALRRELRPRGPGGARRLRGSGPLARRPAGLRGGPVRQRHRPPAAPRGLPHAQRRDRRGPPNDRGPSPRLGRAVPFGGRLADPRDNGAHARTAQAVIDILRGLGCPCIMGNHDEFLLEPRLIETYTEAPIIVQAVDWCRSTLSSRALDFVRTFERSRSIELDGRATLFVYHGSPRSHLEDILATTPPEELDTLLDGRSADVMAGGHTHIQMMSQHRGTLVVNPGSVGLPFKEYVAGKQPTVLVHAEYAIVEASGGAVGVRLRRVPVDGAAMRDAALATDSPMRAMLAAIWGGSGSPP